MILSVLYGTLALALHDHVTPSWPSPRAISSTRGLKSVKVSSSNMISLTSGMFSLIHLTSAITLSAERVR